MSLRDVVLYDIVKVVIHFIRGRVNCRSKYRESDVYRFPNNLLIRFAFFVEGSTGVVFRFSVELLLAELASDEVRPLE